MAVGRSWTLWHVDFDPASPSVTTVISGWKLWLVSTHTELARELCRDSRRLVDLLKLLERGGERLKHIHWAIQKTGESLVLPRGYPVKSYFIAKYFLDLSIIIRSLAIKKL